MHIIYFLTFDYSLESWKKDGHLDRELSFFNELVNLHNFKITIVSYGSSKSFPKKTLNKNLSVIHVYDYLNYSKYRAIRYLKVLKLPFILKKLTQNDFDLIKQNQIQGSLVAVMLKFLSKKPLFVRTGYDVYEFAKKNNRSVVRLFLIYLYQQVTIFFSNLYTVSSNADMKNIYKRFITRNNIYLLHNWVGETKFIEHANRLKGEILTVGRMESQKNLHLIINNLKENSLKHTHIGSGSLQDSLEKTALKNGVKLKVLKPIKNSDLVKKYSLYSFYISSSKFEGNSKTILEAMAAGCVVIASNIPNNQEIIDNRVNGFLLELDDFNFINIINMLEDNIEELDKIGLKAREKINKQFSQKILIEQEISILKKLNLFY